MEMTIDESITELEKARDSIEPYFFIDEAIDQAMKTAIEVMHKYQKIEEIYNHQTGWALENSLREVIEDGKYD